MGVIKEIAHWILNLNLFQKVETMRDTDSNNIHKQKQSTRVYLVTLTTSFMVLILFTMLTKKDFEITVKSPSLLTYNDLEKNFLTTLSCPCQHVAIKYDSFLSIRPIYHQVKINRHLF